MSEHRRYSRKDKVSAVAAAAASSVLAAAQESGIPRSTIRYWLQDPEFAELRQNAREEIGAGYSVISQEGQRLLMARLPTMETKDVIALTDMATRNAQLLSGGATGRTEHRDVTDSFDDHEWAALTELLRERAHAGD